MRVYSKYIFALFGSLFLISLLMQFYPKQAVAKQATVQRPRIITSNPYTGKFGPPDCTWYAWQRLHDTEHIDLQFVGDAGSWITLAQQNDAAWSELTHSYVQIQITTTPQAGDIVVLPYPDAIWARPSHVAYVESVETSNLFAVSAQSYEDYRPGANTQPYPYVSHALWPWNVVQDAEQGHGRFLHFLVAQQAPVATSTTQPQIDKAQWITNSPSIIVNPGQQFAIQFTYQNNGTTTWSDSGNYALACDTFYHQTSNCMNGSPVGLNGQPVAPGQQFTFSVALTAPSSPGTYTTWWDMTHHGSIFGDNNASVQITVQNSSTPPTAPAPPTQSPSPVQPEPPPPADNSQWISNSPAITAQSGQQFSIQFTYQNNGTTTWSDSGSYALACDTFYHTNSNCMGGNPVGFGGQNVAPGQQFTFNFTLTAPSSPGTYTTWWDMTHNGSIFGNNNSYVTITVQTPTPSTPPVDNSQWVSNSSPVTVQPGQQFTIQFTYQNNGTTTWSDSGGYALVCDTYYHSNSNCMGGNPVGLNGQSVAPGQQFAFNLTLTAPSSSGTYQTWWDMAHNNSIFGNNNSYVIVNVVAPPPPTPQWQPLLQQAAPDCNNPGGTTWDTPLPAGTSLSCSNGGLLMQQTSQYYYAEVNLDQVGGNTYSQTTFKVQVQATFESPSDNSTWASVIVQTPQAAGAVGGFIFVVNPAGQWQLQQAITGTNIPVVASGTTSINNSQPITITMIVQNGTLYGYINGQQVLTYGDTLNPSPGLVGLLVEKPNAAPSSYILYTNFELDMWG